MKRITVGLSLGLILGLGAVNALADPVTLHEFAFNENGNVNDVLGGTLTGNVPGAGQIATYDLTGWSDTTGLGQIVITYNPGAGSYNFGAFFHYSISSPGTPELTNEYGFATGSPDVGQTWQIDEPGYNCDSMGNPINPAGPCGTIFNNFSATPPKLNNTTSETAFNPFDASFAMNFAFTLDATQKETITLDISTQQPGSGFFLTQVNSDSNARLYFEGSAAGGTNSGGGGGGGGSVPEPGTMVLVGSGVLALVRNRLRGRKAA